MKKHIPIRMCIVCRDRFEQRALYKFKIVSEKITQDVKYGRSFYLCQFCFEKEDKILQKAFSRVCKNLNTKITQQGLKEIFLNGKN